MIRLRASCVLFHAVSTGAAFLSSSPSSPRSVTTLRRLIEEPTSSSKKDDAGVVDTVAPTVPPTSLPAIAGTGTKRLFLVRHGEVVNPGGSVAVYYGAMDVPLSFLGQKEAVAAAKYLAQYDLSAVYCSPLSRAYYGAQQVAYRQKNPDTASGPIKLDGFKELERGYWRGKSKQQIGERLVAAFDAGDPKATPMGGESYRELNQRVLRALDKVMATLQPGQAAAIVSHLQVTRCIVAAALGVPLDQLTKIKISTASITCIDYVPSVVPQTVVHFQSFKPSVGLAESADGAN
jgi:broad specificity phosphatase PhoE